MNNEPSHAAILLRIEALLASMLDELRRRANPDEIDLHELLPRVWGAYGGVTWCVNDLKRASMVKPSVTNTLGQSLRRLVDGEDKGRIGDLLLTRVELNGKGNNTGRIWQLEWLD